MNTMRNSLHEAVKNNDIKSLRKLLDAGADVNEKENAITKNTPLHLAIKTTDNTEILKLLLNAGAKADIKNGHGKTVQQQVLVNSDFEKIKILFEAKVDLSGKDNQGQVAIHHAARNNNPALIEFLLTEKINEVNAKSMYDKTPLHFAAEHSRDDSHFSTIQLLIKNGADVNAVTKNICSTSLHYLIENSNLKSAQLLLNHQADANKKDSDEKIPLFYAVTYNNFEMVKLLVDHGSLVNVKDGEENIPLYYAVTRNNAKIVKLLVDSGSDVNYTKKLTGSSLLHEIAHCQKSDNNFYEIAEILLKKRARVNAQDLNGMTPLHLFIKIGRVDIVQLLLNYNASIKIKCHGGKTAFFKAIFSGNSEMVQLLLDHGANVNECLKTIYGVRLILQEACELYKNSNVIKCLLSNGANLCSNEEFKSTPQNQFHFLPTREFHTSKDKFLKTLVPFLKYVNFNAAKNNVFHNPSNYGTSLYVNKFLEFVAICKELNIPVHQSIFDSISKESRFNDFYQLCLCELSRAKSTKLRNSWVTFFNLLVDNKRKLKNYARNKDLIENCKSIDWSVNFPIYGVQMKENVKKGIKKRKLYEKSLILLSNFLPIYNPTHLIIRDILDCTTTKNLSKFCN